MEIIRFQTFFFKSFQYNGKKCYRDVDFQTNKNINVPFNYKGKRLCGYKVKIDIWPIIGIAIACIVIIIVIGIVIWRIVVCLKQEEQEDRDLKDDKLKENLFWI